MLLGTILTLITLITLSKLYKAYYNMKNPKTLYIIRGLPGSGKSTLAAQIAVEKNINRFEADMYFTNAKTGTYNFDFNNLYDAHLWCRNHVFDEILNGRSVIVSNTFTRWREMREYIDAANGADFKIKVIHCMNDFGSIHNVPKDVIAKMTDRFQPNDQLPHNFGIEYSEHLVTAEMVSDTTDL